MNWLYRIAVLVLFLISNRSIATDRVHFYTEVAAPYYFFNDHGQAQGISVDLVEALNENTEIVGELHHLPWARAVRETQQNANIILTSVLRTAKREAHFQWLGVVDMARASLIGLREPHSIKLESIDAAQNAVVGTIRGYGAATFLLEKGFVEDQNLVLVTQPEQLWSMLFKQRVDYVMSNALTGKYEAKSLGLDPSQLHTVLDIRELTLPLEMATGHNTPQKTVEQISEGIERLKREGHYQRIIAKWSQPITMTVNH